MERQELGKQPTLRLPPPPPPSDGFEARGESRQKDGGGHKPNIATHSLARLLELEAGAYISHAAHPVN